MTAIYGDARSKADTKDHEPSSSDAVDRLHGSKAENLDEVNHEIHSPQIQSSDAYA